MARSAFSALVFSCLVACGAAAQDGGWPTNFPAAVQAAQQAQKPLFIWGVRSTKDADYNSERDDRIHAPQRNALNDPDVRAALQNFVPCKMNVSLNKPDAQRFGLQRWRAVIVTPDGQKLLDLGVEELKSPPDILAALRDGHIKYGAMRYENGVRTAITGEDVAPGIVRDALRFVENYRVQAADRDIAALLKRPRLDPGTRSAAWSALAAIASDGAIDALVSEAATSRQAAAALSECDERAGAALVRHLRDDDAGARLAAYAALVRIFDIPSPKGPRFFEMAPQTERVAEIERVQTVVAKAQQDAEAPAAKTAPRKDGPKPKKKRGKNKP